MRKLQIDQIAKKLFHGEIRSITIDSRKVRKGDLFLALPGTRVHGNAFIEVALEKGAQYVVADIDAPYPKGSRVLPVKHVENYLWEVSKKIRALSKAKFVAITGSNGKTTTKDLLYQVLGGGRKILKTEGNFNNHIGVPLSLCRLKEHHKIAVLELGTSFPGEIERLTQLVKPDIAILTSIYRAHLEGFKNLNGVAVEKSNIFSKSKKNCVCMVRPQDLKYKSVKESVEGKSYHTFGISEEVEQSLKLTSQGYTWLQNKHRFEIASPAKHNVENAMATIKVAECLNIPLTRVSHNLKLWKPAQHRMCLLQWKKRKIIDDCYNANPASVDSALETAINLKKKEDQKVYVVLGDMKELGKSSSRFHQEIGKKMAKVGVDVLLTMGEHTKRSVFAYEELGGRHSFHGSDVTDIVNFLKAYTRPFDIILIKGSRSMKMEEILDKMDSSLAS